MQAFALPLAIYILRNPTTSATHTFNVAGAAIYASIQVEAYAGATAASPPDQTGAGTSDSGATSLATSSVTPSEDNEIVLAFIARNGVGSFTASGGFTVGAQTPGVAATSFAGAVARLIQTTAAAASTTFAWTPTASAASRIVSLKFVAAGTAPGIAAETDAALALSGKQIRALGLATETDAALALTGTALAGLPFNTSAYEFGQRTGLDIEDFSLYASTSLNVSVFADADVLLASRLFAYTESTGSDGRLTRKTHASLTASNWYFFVARNADGSLSGCGRIQAT